MHPTITSSLLAISLTVGLTSLTQAQGTSTNTTPQSFWVSQPVGPDETVLVAAGNISSNSMVKASRVPDTAPGTPFQASASGSAPTTIQPIKTALSSLFFPLPKAWEPGLYKYQIQDTSGTSKPSYINLPDTFFIIGDRGETATPGGWIQAHGTALRLNKTPATAAPASLLLAKNGAPVAVLTPENDRRNNAYRQRFKVPAGLAEGTYDVYLHNGCGGSEGWSRYEGFDVDGTPLTTITIARNDWPTNEIAVTIPTGVSPDDAVKQALEKAKSSGGGVVTLPAGEFAMTNPIVMPEKTVLKGAGMAKTRLKWGTLMVGIAKPDTFDTAVTGCNFGVEDLALDLASDFNPAVGFVKSTKGSFVHRVTIEHPNTIKATDLAVTTKRPWGYASCFPGVWMSESRNIAVSDSVINASTPIHPHISSDIRIEDNTLIWRHYHSHIQNRCRALVFDNNRFLFRGLLNEGVVSSGWEPRLFFTARFNNQRDVYIGNNSSESEIVQKPGFNGLFGHDTSGGGYIGKIASVDPATGDLTVASDFKKVNAGSIVQIISGKGAGQYRYASSRPGNAPGVIPVNKPWDVMPDSGSSVILRNVQGRFLIIDNDVPFDGRWSNYFTSHDVIIAGNKLGGQKAPEGEGQRGLMNFEHGGFTSAQGHSIGGFATLLHHQVLDNDVVRNGLIQTGNFVVKEPPFAGYDGATVMDYVVRNNRTTKELEPKANFTIRGVQLVQGDGLLVENNSGVKEIRLIPSTWGNPSVGVVRGNTDPAGAPLKISPLKEAATGSDLVIDPVEQK